MTDLIYTKVNTKEYKETTNPGEILLTEDLGSCVCLGLMAEIGGKKKRGLAHIYYGGDVAYVKKKPFSWSGDHEKRDFAVIKQKDEKRILCRLEEISEQFRKLASSKKLIPLNDINSYVIANRKKEGGIAANGDNCYSNPAFDLISNWLSNQGMMLKFSDSNHHWKKESDKEDKRLYQIARKSVILREDGFALIYKNLRDTWLNSHSGFKPF